MRSINHLLEHLKKSVETGEPFFPQEHDIEMLERYTNTSTDPISRADAIEMAVDVETPQGTYERAIYVDDLMALPSADAVSREFYEDAVKANIGIVIENRKLKEQIESADAVEGWSNHEVACILAELFGDDCACNYNGIDEWLPMVCDFKDNCQTVGVACWEQFLKHYGERREP